MGSFQEERTPSGIIPWASQCTGSDQGRREAVGLPEGLAEVGGAGEPPVQDEVLQTCAEDTGMRP